MDATTFTLPGGVPLATAAAALTDEPARCSKSWHPNCTRSGGAVLKHAESQRTGVCCCCRAAHGLLGAGHADAG